MILTPAPDDDAKLVKAPEVDELMMSKSVQSKFNSIAPSRCWHSRG